MVTEREKKRRKLVLTPVHIRHLAKGRVLRLRSKYQSFSGTSNQENPEVAKQISDLMTDMFTRLSDSWDSVKKLCSEQEYKAYLKSTARIAGAIVIDVMEPLCEKHPDLKPRNWDEIDTVRG
jgi:hypothetical protein